MLYVLYTSTKSNNCRDFVNKLDYPYIYDLDKLKDIPNKDFILITGTYADVRGKGSIHPSVLSALKNRNFVKHLKGVVASGNRVFGDKFALTGKLISNTLDIPNIHNFELKGLPKDVSIVRNYIDSYNDTGNNND